MSGTVQTKRVRVPALKYLLFFSFLSGQVYNGNTLFSAYTDDPDDEEHYSNLINNDGNINILDIVELNNIILDN